MSKPGLLYRTALPARPDRAEAHWSSGREKPGYCQALLSHPPRVPLTAPVPEPFQDSAHCSEGYDLSRNRSVQEARMGGTRTAARILALKTPKPSCRPAFTLPWLGWPLKKGPDHSRALGMLPPVDAVLHTCLLSGESLACLLGICGLLCPQLTSMTKPIGGPAPGPHSTPTSVRTWPGGRSRPWIRALVCYFYSLFHRICIFKNRVLSEPSPSEPASGDRMRLQGVASDRSSGLGAWTEEPRCTGRR